MKMLAGRLPLMKGHRKEGHNVVVSYFSQDQDDLLTSTRTVWEEVYSVAPSHVVPQLRTLLGCFLFSGDTIEKPISVLSGGERSRLVLCKLLLSPANCLLLDEPTNHLDIRSKDILMDALREYGGTLVFVSHDRYFLDGLATRVLEIGGETATSVSRELRGLSGQEGGRFGAGQAGRGGAGCLRVRQNRAVRSRNVPGKESIPYKLQALAGKIEELESTIQTHETRVAVLAQMLASEELYRDYSLFRTTMEEHDRLQEELAGFMQKWEKLQSELAAMQPATDS